MSANVWLLHEDRKVQHQQHRANDYERVSANESGHASVHVNDCANAHHGCDCVRVPVYPLRVEVVARDYDHDCDRVHDRGHAHESANARPVVSGNKSPISC